MPSGAQRMVLAHAGLRGDVAEHRVVARIVTSHIGFDAVTGKRRQQMTTFRGTRKAAEQRPLKSHVFDVPQKTNVAVHGVPPGRAMPIPYTGACGTCHVVNELPFK
jgi:hypothetical protein